MAGSPLTVRLVRNGREYQDVLRIRKTVFGREQKVPASIDLDKYEKTSKHVIVFYEGRPIGCARIRFIGSKIKLERIAILKKYRGLGFGKQLMGYLIAFARRHHVKTICMYAQYHLVEYYKKFGFRPRGKRFKEFDVDHIEMRV